MDLVSPGIGLIFWQIIAFLTVLLLLRRYAWSPILSGIRARDNSIYEALQNAKKAREETEQLKKENELLLAEARKEREKLLNDAIGIGDNIKEKAKEDAEKISKKMIEDAKRSIESQKKAALNEVRNQVAEFSLEIAEKLMRRNLKDERSQKELVDEFIRDIKKN